MKNMNGRRFGRLKVVKRHPVNYLGKKARWMCVCDCGNKVTVLGQVLREGRSRSCGCLKAESKPNFRHGYAGATQKDRARVYQAWIAMRNRSDRVVKRWEKFVNFLADMGEPRGIRTSLDRIDNSKGYSRGNCRWATQTEQVRNRENTLFAILHGKRIPFAEACELSGLKYQTAFQRKQRGWPDKAIFGTPNCGKSGWRWSRSEGKKSFEMNGA